MKECENNANESVLDTKSSLWKKGNDKNNPFAKNEPSLKVAYIAWIYQQSVSTLSSGLDLSRLANLKLKFLTVSISDECKGF